MLAHASLIVNDDLTCVSDLTTTNRGRAFLSRGSFDTPPPLHSRPRSGTPRPIPTAISRSPAASPRAPRPRDVQPGHEIGRGSGARMAKKASESASEAARSLKESVQSSVDAALAEPPPPPPPAPAAHAAAEDPSRGAHVTLPVSSAKKLRFYDNADLAEIVAGHLEEKQALAEERALLLLELEAALARVPGVDDAAAEAKRRVAENPDHERVGEPRRRRAGARTA